jgi:hypothetical protein
MAKYPLPAFLEGHCEPSVFYKWVNCKARTLLRRDKRRGKPYAKTATRATYKDKIHQAVFESGERDPFTGDLLAWELIGTWDSSTTHSEEYERQYALMPTIDHSNPDILNFEICSWLVNDCKSYLTPDEFKVLCQKVADRAVPAA